MIAPIKDKAPVEQDRTFGKRPHREVAQRLGRVEVTSDSMAPTDPTTDAQRQLRKDRIVALVVLLVMAAIFGLIVWFAAQFPASPDSSTYEPWMMW